MPAGTRRGVLPRRVFFCALVSALLTAIVAWAYAPGLHGPLILDDAGSLSPLSAWLAGEVSWQEVVFGNPSGVFGRSLPMAAFLANAALGGDSVYALKLGNLFIHLWLGGLVFLAARAVLAHTVLAPQRSLWAFAVTAVWLLHPLQLSTVLYVVQRMTQMSALFTLLAVIAWFIARARFATGDRNAGRWLLFAGVPLATGLAVVSKENGALAPLLCIVLDLALFGWSASRPREIRIFIGLTLAGGVAGVLLALSSGFLAGLMAAYEIRDFTLAERLLTQPRVLADYVGQWFWPDLARLGLYHDGFAPSRGWLEPSSTVLAMLAWGIVLVASIAFRRHAPLVAAGLWFYLTGQLIESSAIGLELYFEHRNYLPNFGLALATVGMVDAIARRSGKASPARLPIAVAIVLVPMLALATHAKATVWANGERIAREAVVAHAESIRAWTDLAGEAMRRGDEPTVRQALQGLAASRRKEAQRIAVLYEMIADCIFSDAIEPERLETLRPLADGPLTLFQQQSFGSVVDQITSHGCLGIDSTDLADLMLENVVASAQPEYAFPKWRMRFHAARLHEHQHRYSEAAEIAQISWAAGVRDPALAALLAFAYEQSGQPDLALQVLDEALAVLRPSHADRPLLVTLRERVMASRGDGNESD